MFHRKTPTFNHKNPTFHQTSPKFVCLFVFVCVCQCERDKESDCVCVWFESVCQRAKKKEKKRTEHTYALRVCKIRTDPKKKQNVFQKIK